MDIRGTVLIQADNVTLRNVKLTSNDYWPILVKGVNCLIEDSTIIGAASSQASIGDNDGHNTFRRLNLYGGQDGIKVGAYSTLRDSYIHDLARGATIHNDGIEVNGTTGVRILHNSSLNSNGQTSAIFIGGKETPSQDILVQGNLFAGGGYTVYGPVGDPGVAHSSNVRVVDNIISTRFFPRGGDYGPLAYWEGGSGNVWANNVWSDGPKQGQGIPAT